MQTLAYRNQTSEQKLTKMFKAARGKRRPTYRGANQMTDLSLEAVDERRTGGLRSDIKA